MVSQWIRQFKLMIWKEFCHIRNDPMTIRLMIFPIFIQLLVLGYALNTEITNTPIAIIDESRTPQSRSLTETLKASYLFQFKGMLDARSEAREYLDKGETKLVLIIPADFASKLDTKDGASVQLLVDGQDANSSNVASGYISSILSQWGMQRLQQTLKGRGIHLETMVPISITPVILFNPLLKSTWYMIPALVVLLVTMVTSLLTGFSIVKEREAGTLEQLMVTPLQSIHLIAGKTVPYMIAGIIELGIFLIFATQWFGIPFRGNIFVFLLFGIIYMISSLGIGILTSTIAKTAQQVLFLIWFILIFFILLSGFFVPVENMPEIVQKLTYLNPVRFFMFAVREIFLKGSGIGELWHTARIMLIIGISVFSASLIFFHRRAG